MEWNGGENEVILLRVKMGRDGEERMLLLIIEGKEIYRQEVGREKKGEGYDWVCRGEVKE